MNTTPSGIQYQYVEGGGVRLFRNDGTRIRTRRELRILLNEPIVYEQVAGKANFNPIRGLQFWDADSFEAFLDETLGD